MFVLQWGEKHGLGVPSDPVLVDTRNWLPVASIAVLAHDGHGLSMEELHWHHYVDVVMPPEG